MMKKIRNIRELKKAKKMLQQREKELLRKISSGWRDLKEDIYPRNILREQIKRCRTDNPRTEEESLLKSILSNLTSVLAKKLAKKAGEKFEKFFS